MGPTMASQNPAYAIFLEATIITILFAATPLNAQPNRQDARCFEGVYTLEEFKRDGEVFRPPQVSGRYVLMDGVIVWIFNDRTQPSKETSTTAFGRYTLDQSSFAYGYDEYEAYTQTDAGLSVSRKVPWQGLRPYAFDTDGSHIRNTETKTEFSCSGDGLTYAYGDGNYRKYRRAKSGE